MSITARMRIRFQDVRVLSRTFLWSSSLAIVTVEKDHYGKLILVVVYAGDRGTKLWRLKLVMALTLIQIFTYTNQRSIYDLCTNDGEKKILKRTYVSLRK